MQAPLGPSQEINLQPYLWRFYALTVFRFIRLLSPLENVQVQGFGRKSRHRTERMGIWTGSYFCVFIFAKERRNRTQ